MADRQYYVGDIIKVDWDYYKIIGKITYMNKNDGKCWDEYRLSAVHVANTERWLSIDNYYKEYSLSLINPNAGTIGFHSVDKGVEQVVAVFGDVDVEVGDTAPFEEFEDSEEERIVSVEHWDDGDEYSSGYYLDPWEFGKDDEDVKSYRTKSSEFWGGVTAFACFFILFLLALVGQKFGGNKKIEKYVKKETSKYEYVTSITGSDKQKANVYKAKNASAVIAVGADNDTQVELVAQDIIDGIEGNTESVQQNTEDGDYTIAILTEKEYCIVYRGDDDRVYVQVSPRKYAYTSDKEPYHSRAGTYRYFRRFYYSRGYGSDSSTYSNSTSSYYGYSDGTIDYNSNNSLNSYSQNVRQESINSRSSDGGGLSSGK